MQAGTGGPPPAHVATGTLGAVLLPLMIVVLVLCALLGAWAVWFAVRDRAVILKQLWGAAVVEGVLVVQLVATVTVAFLELRLWQIWQLGA